MSRKRLSIRDSFIAKFGNWATLSQTQKNALPIIANEYFNFINANNQIIGYSEENITDRTVLLNNYYNFINVNQYLQSNNWRDKINISVRGVGRIESGVVYVSNVPIKADGTYKYWMG